MIVIPQLKLCYQNLPKVASTTIFSWLYECSHNKPYAWDAPGAMDVHYSLTLGANPVATQVEHVAFNAGDYPDYFKFVLTRDPIRRFLSMYSNRVVFYQELSPSSAAAGRLKALGLQYSPEINVLVDNLDAYEQVDPNLHHHARPMVDFMGSDISIFNRIADVNQFEEVSREIRRHFEQSGLPGAAMIDPPKERMQSQGPKIGPEILNPWSFEVLLDYYKEDYALLPTVSLKNTKDAYTAARNQYKERIREKLPDALAIAKKIAPAGAAAPVITYPPCPVATVYFEPRSLPKLAIGTVLLQRGFSPKEWKLVAKIDGQTVPVRWRIASPVMEKNYADNPNARNARFQVNGLDAMQREFNLELHGPSDQQWVVITIKTPKKKTDTA